MAFHQPTRPALQRTVRPAAEERDSFTVQPSQPTHEQQLNESQTWVLFSPATEATTTSEYSESAPSLQTPGRSRISDLGSLHTAPRYEQHLDGSLSATPSVIDEEAIEDDAELDSLDSHLPSFRSLPGLSVHSQHGVPYSAPVLPAHDGLGSFQLDQPVSSIDAQNQIYQFERFNPRRTRRRRESLEHAHSAVEFGLATEDEKRERIEAWRLEQSRVLVEEVQRETRRRRESQASLRQTKTMPAVSQVSQVADETASDNMTWHDEEALVSGSEPEGYLARFTHKIIKDILGIDDHMLSVLLGETMLDEDELSTTPRASQLSGQVQPDEDAAFHERILERVSRELGLLVNQLSHHPGAFSTFSRIQSMPLPYAGLPVIPEAANTQAGGDESSTARSEVLPSPAFEPTVNQGTQPIDITSRPKTAPAQEDVDMGNTFTKEEWEQDLDVKLVFRYIRSRFSSRPTSSPQTGASHLAASNTQDTAAKAARVRQHHPLISRSRPTDRRSFKATTPSSPVALRHHSSCASQSTRRSARRSSCSSRHYWDLGGSLGTGSVIASNGPMGSWGEV